MITRRLQLSGPLQLSTWQSWVDRPSPRHRPPVGRRQFAPRDTWARVPTASAACRRVSRLSRPWRSQLAGDRHAVTVWPPSHRAKQTSASTRSDWSSWSSVYDTRRRTRRRIAARSTCLLYHQQTHRTLTMHNAWIRTVFLVSPYQY